MTDIVERIEQAEGASREMDAEIALSMPDRFFDAGPQWTGGPRMIGEIDRDGNRCTPGNAPDMLVPAYTASLDAAMTLVPSWCFPHMRYDFGRGWVCEMHNSIGIPFAEYVGSSLADRPHGFLLALLAAALKARAS